MDNEGLRFEIRLVEKRLAEEDIEDMTLEYLTDRLRWLKDLYDKNNPPDEDGR